MVNIKTLLAVVIGLAVLSATYLWQSSQSSPEADATLTTSEDSKPKLPIEESSIEESTELEEPVSSNSDEVGANDTSEPTDTPSQDSTLASPFEVIEEDTEQTNSETEPQAESETEFTPEPANADTSNLNLGDVVVVPESYPVTDADKYFVPKDQRGPGNLGGPPPLNFPGGPSDPNQATTEIGIPAPPSPVE